MYVNQSTCNYVEEIQLLQKITKPLKNIMHGLMWISVVVVVAIVNTEVEIDSGYTYFF